MVSCGGNPICQTGCDAIFLVSFALCASTYGDCEVAALYVVYGQCLDNCPLGGGGGCAAADHTATTALSLEETALGQKAASAPVHFALERAEKRGDESFVMDEWAVVQDGRIKASSNPAFARAVTGQQTMPAQGSFLMIQEPVHPMNSRHVPKPEVSVSSTVLSPSQRGRGEVVAARIEISPAGIVDRVEVVYTSKPLDKGRLEKLVSQRVGVVFASEKGHRTAVYVAFRLTDRLEILSTAAVFPKCC
jgi:hypothetical protein